MLVLLLPQSQDAPIGRGVNAAGSKIIKGLFGDANDVVANELRSFAGAILLVFQATLPLQHCPAVIVVCSQFGEDRLEVDLPVTQGAEAAGTVRLVGTARGQPTSQGTVLFLA